MSILTYITEAVVADSVVEIDGKTLNRPSLLASDGLALTYAVDVNIGQKEPLRAVPIAHGNMEIVYADVGAAVRLRRSASGRFEIIGFSKRLPGTYHAVPVQLPTFTFKPMVRYGQVVVPTSTGSMVVGTPQQVGWTSRPITFGEFVDFGGFGTVPLGAIAQYKDGVFVSLTF